MADLGYTEELLKFTHGEGQLYSAYSSMGFLRRVEARIKDISCENKTNEFSATDFAMFDELRALRRMASFHQRYIEKILLTPSQSLFNRPKNSVNIGPENMGLLLAFASYLILMDDLFEPKDSGLTSVAENTVLNILSLQPGAPVITDAYSEGVDVGIVPDATYPDLVLRKVRGSDESIDDLNEVKITLTGSLALRGVAGVKPFEFDPKVLGSTIVGSKAISEYLKLLNNGSSPVMIKQSISEKIVNQLGRLYATSDPEDYLLGEVKIPN